MTVTSTREAGPSEDSALIRRDMEKMFCSDPVDEQGVNTVQKDMK